MEQPKTFDELMRALLAACPEGSMGEDNQGQLIFYTDWKEDKDGNLFPFDPDAEPEES